jgi:hypothetical protein
MITVSALISIRWTTARNVARKRSGDICYQFSGDLIGARKQALLQRHRCPMLDGG